MEPELTHDQIVSRVASWLSDHEWVVAEGPSLPATDQRTAVIYAIQAEMRKQGGKSKGRGLEWLVKPDILAGKGTMFKDFVSIAVEITVTSDVKREAHKLHILKVDRRLIVTRPYLGSEGELDGMPIVSCSNLDEVLMKWILSGRLGPLRKAIQKRGS